MKTYFTYANSSTAIGQERIEIAVKIFRLFLGTEEIGELNLSLNFYRKEIKEKPKARFIVFSIVKKEFGFGIFTEKEVKRGKEISKENNFTHEYISIDELF